MGALEVVGRLGGRGLVGVYVGRVRSWRPADSLVVAPTLWPKRRYRSVRASRVLAVIELASGIVHSWVSHGSEFEGDR